eukprot:1996195-Prymnesium_polylepis.1
MGWWATGVGRRGGGGLVWFDGALWEQSHGSRIAALMTVWPHTALDRWRAVQKNRCSGPEHTSVLLA